jgi:pimeloyl-ACP methyl ester carboxylesterase
MDTAATQTEFSRADVRFRSGGEECGAWLYSPAPQPSTAAPQPSTAAQQPSTAAQQAAGTPPQAVGSPSQPAGAIVVLGHGLGAVKEMGLDAYAERFVANGYSALVFDYRHFGASDGTPRQLLDIGRQLEDWRAAVAYARSLPGIDPARVALFGSSFGGGHAIRTAAADPGIAATIAQCPFTDGIASGLTLGPVSSAKVGALAIRDTFAALRGRAPVLVDLAGAPGSAALMPVPDSVPGFLGLVPAGLDFTNVVAARIATRIPINSPGRAARRVKTPIMFCVCEKDSVAPARATLKHAARAPRGEIVRYPVGHFEIYTGEPFERAVADQVAFLRRHLG